MALVGLLENMGELCVMLRKARQPDGEGGYTEQWVNDFEFTAAIASKGDTIEAKIAEKMGVTSVFNVVADKSIGFEYHDAFRVLSTGETYRITSTGRDSVTPKMSGLNLTSANAEKWVIGT